MDLIELQEMMNKSFVGKKIDYDFDLNCSRLINICLTEGVPHLYHQIEFNRVKVTIEGMESQYIGIQPHRVPFTWMDIQKMVEEKAKLADVFIPDINIKELQAMKESDAELFEKALDDLVTISGLDKEKIRYKIEVVKCD